LNAIDRDRTHGMEAYHDQALLDQHFLAQQTYLDFLLVPRFEKEESPAHEWPPFGLGYTGVPTLTTPSTVHNL